MKFCADLNCVAGSVLACTQENNNSGIMINNRRMWLEFVQVSGGFVFTNRHNNAKASHERDQRRATITDEW